MPIRTHCGRCCQLVLRPMLGRQRAIGRTLAALCPRAGRAASGSPRRRRARLAARDRRAPRRPTCARIYAPRRSPTSGARPAGWETFLRCAQRGSPASADRHRPVRLRPPSAIDWCSSRSIELRLAVGDRQHSSADLSSRRWQCCAPCFVPVGISVSRPPRNEHGPITSTLDATWSKGSDRHGHRPNLRFPECVTAEYPGGPRRRRG